MHISILKTQRSLSIRKLTQFFKLFFKLLFHTSLTIDFYLLKYISLPSGVHATCIFAFLNKSVSLETEIDTPNGSSVHSRGYFERCADDECSRRFL